MNRLEKVFDRALARAGGVKSSRWVTADWPSNSTFAFARMHSRVGLSDFSDPVATPDASIAIVVSLMPIAAKDVQQRFDGRIVDPASVPVCGTSVLDLCADPRVWIGVPFDQVLFQLPRVGLDDIALDHGITPIQNFRYIVGARDLVMAQFTKLILPVVTTSRPISPLALDQLSLLLGAHLLSHYAGINGLQAPRCGGLAAWQKKRVLEFLREHLDGNIRVRQAAELCGLSVSHFARAFKATYGTSTLQWVIGQRVVLAKQLLACSRLSLSEIAIKSGFADQSALSRAFLKIVGLSPARWRRELLGSRSFDGFHRLGVGPNQHEAGSDLSGSRFI